MQAMSTKKYASAKEASRPFDKDRSGFILGEGAGILILEELEHALKRNATIYAELLGYADGYHLTKPNEEGDGGYRAMKRALEQANLNPSDVDHINCHATSTTVGDNAEAKAIAKLLENSENIKKTSISACKGAIGHCFAGAGAIETIFALLSMNHNLAPPILNLKSTPEVNLNYVTEEKARKKEINCVIKNSFGFGGINVALLFKKIKI